MPARGMISVGVDASELMEILLLALPADKGANVTLKVTLCPAASVRGKLIPFRAKLLAVAVVCKIAAWVMVTSDPPELVTVAESV